MAEEEYVESKFEAKEKVICLSNMAALYYNWPYYSRQDYRSVCINISHTCREVNGNARSYSFAYTKRALRELIDNLEELYEEMDD